MQKKTDSSNLKQQQKKSQTETEKKAIGISWSKH